MSRSRASVLSALLLTSAFVSLAAQAQHPSTAAQADNYAVYILERSKSPVNQQIMALIGKKDFKGLRNLIKKGTSIDEADNKGCRPIHYAAYMGSLEAMKIFAANRADLKASTFGRWSALHYAALGGHTEVIDFLVASGVPIDIVDSGGESPLFYAVESGHMATVQWLIEHGANINHENRKGDTPLSVAIENGHRRLVEYLRQLGAAERSGEAQDTRGAIE